MTCFSYRYVPNAGLFRGGLGLDKDLDFGENALVALDFAFELAGLLDLGDGDVLLVNLDAGGGEGLGHLGGRHGAVELAALADLGGELDFHGLDLGGSGLGVSDELGLFVGALAEDVGGIFA